MNNGKISKFIMLLSAFVLAICSFSVVAFADGEEEVQSEVSYSAKYDGGYALERVAIANPFDYVVKHTAQGEDETEEDLSAKEVAEFKVYQSNADFDTELSEDLLVEGEFLNKDNNTVTYVYRDGYEINADEETEGVVYYYKAVVVIGEGEEDSVEIVTNVKVVAYAPALTYKDFSLEEDAELLVAARGAAAESDCISGTTYTLPKNEIWGLVNSPVLDLSSVQILLYVAKPNSDFPTSVTSKATNGTYPTISLSASGTYRFWVLYNNAEFKSEYSEEITTDGLEYREDGWYDGENLIIPVFSFEYSADNKVSITTSGGGEKGIKNYTYDNIKFTVKNGNVMGWELLYTDKTDENGDPKDFREATAEEAEFDLDAFTTSSTSFKPLTNGYFKVRCIAVGTNADVIERKDSAIVKVDREYEEVEVLDTRFRDFVTNNWKSLIFLGLAVLSLVGIVVVALYKPKTPNGGKKKSKAVVKEEESKVEEAEEPQAEEAEEVEEAAEEVEETPVEEAEEPAPAEEKVEEPAPVEEKAEEPAPAEEKAEEPAPVEEKAEEPAPAEEKAEEPAPAEEKVEEPAPAEEKVEEPAPDGDKQE